jgi:hypothetical protein
MMRTHTGIDTPTEGSVIVHKARTAVTAIVFATATAVTTPLVLAPASAAPGITFGNPAAYAPNIDKITVAPAYLP